MRATLSGLALAAVLLSGCSGRSRGDADLADALTLAFADAAQDERTVTLDEVVEGDWDRVAFVCPYEEESEVDEKLGFDWAEFPGRDDTEVHALFVFVRDDEVVTWTDILTARGDPCWDLPETVAREDARFVVDQDGETTGGSPYLRLALAP